MNHIAYLAPQPPAGTLVEGLADANFHITHIRQCREWASPLTPVMIVLDTPKGDITALLAEVKAHPTLSGALPMVLYDPATTDVAQLAYFAVPRPANAGQIIALTENMAWRNHRLLLDTFDSLGHDFKNPLGTLVSSLSILLEMPDADGDMPQKLLQDSLDAAHYQNSLIDNSVDYFRIRAAAYDVSESFAPLGIIWQNFVAHARKRIAKKGMTLTVIDADTIPDAIFENNLLLRSLVAILENSMKFCTRKEEVEISLSFDDNHVRLMIRDTGRPIIAPHGDMLTSYSGQYTARMGSSRASLALNLPFANAVAEFLGGTLSITSDPPWTITTMELPC